MDNGLENLFTNLSISSDTITEEDFKKKDCKKGNGGWKFEDLLKICKDLDITLTSEEFIFKLQTEPDFLKASKEILCDKISNYFKTVGVSTTSNNVSSVPESDTVSSDMVTTGTVSSNVSTTNSNLENLPNEIIIQILEKMPLSSMFNIIKASKKINMLFNKFKNSIIKNHIKYHGKVDLKQPFLYNIKNKKEFKEAIKFLYQFIFKGDASQVNIKKWIKKRMNKSGELSANEAIIILEFISNNNFKSSEFLLNYLDTYLDISRIRNLEAFDVILDINQLLDEYLQESENDKYLQSDEEDSDYESNYEIDIFKWPDNRSFADWIRSSVTDFVLEDNREKFNIVKKKEYIPDIARGQLMTVEEFLGGMGSLYSEERGGDNFIKYFPELYKEY